MTGYILLLIVIAAFAFAAGHWLGHRDADVDAEVMSKLAKESVQYKTAYEQWHLRAMRLEERLREVSHEE